MTSLSTPPPAPLGIRRRWWFMVALLVWGMFLLYRKRPSSLLGGTSSSTGTGRTRSNKRKSGDSGGADTSLSASASSSSSLLLPYIVPTPWDYRRHQDDYDTWVFTDSFLKGDTLHVISMVYVRWSLRPDSFLRISIPSLGIERKEFTTWYVRDEYESSIIGLFIDPRLKTLTQVDVILHYQDESRDYHFSQIDISRGSQYAMCALFHTDAHLMEMWVSYWWLLGVDDFYMYYNGPKEDIEGLQKRASLLQAKTTFLHWPFDYWVPDKLRPHHGQPMAVNDCYYRNRDRHEYMVMYDLDELLVFPKHDDLRSFHASLSGSWLALRSKSSWTRIELEDLKTAYNTLTIDHIAAAPLTRTEIDYRREKYIMNTSYGINHKEINIVNVHGVYQVATGIGVPSVGGPPQVLMDESLAYHFHFVNVGRDRTRDSYVDKPTKDSRAMEIVKANMAKRGRPEKKKI